MPAAPAPASNTAPDDSGRLAVILGASRSERRNYDGVLVNAREAARILADALGPEWLANRADGLARELEGQDGAAVHRATPSKGRNELFGAGLPPPYRALALQPVPTTETGWRIFTALILGGCLLRHGGDNSIAPSSLNSLAQFLVATFEMRGSSERKVRIAFLDSISSPMSLGALSRTSKSAGKLPEAMLSAVRSISAAILKTKPRRPKVAATRPPAIEPVAMPHPGINDAEGDSNTEIISVPTIPSSLAVRTHAAQAAESIAEQAPTAIAEFGDAKPSESFHSRAAHARNAFMEVRQGLWARDQWDALNRIEMRQGVRAWLERARIASDTRDNLEAESAVLVLLIGCTGWIEDRLWTVPFVRSGGAIPEGHHRYIHWDSGELVFPVPESDCRYKPELHGHGALVMPVSETVRLQLPISIAQLISGLATHRGTPEVFWFERSLDDLVEHIRDIIKVARPDEARESIARIRKAHLLELTRSSQDLALSQISCGELIGASDVSMTYVACSLSKVQELYAKVTYTHGYGECPANTDSSLVGGSKLQIETKQAQHFATSMRRGLGQPNGHADDDLGEALRTHNNLVSSLAWQLCALTGLRPQNNVGALTIRNFSLTGRCAVFGEKVLDEGHLGRLVPLCDVLVESLVAYGRHLHAFAELSRLPAPLQAAARESLSGTGSLFFVCNKGKVGKLTVAEMTGHAPRGWILPANTFRHRIASRLREQNCPAVFVEALLGHMELGIQPFGLESFMDPVAYLAMTARHLQALAVEDGWKPLYGLPSDIEQPWDFRPLGRWLLDLEPAHRKSIDEQRAKNRSELEQVRHSLSDEIARRVKAAIEARSPEFFSASDGRLSAEDVRGLRRSLTEACGSLAETAVTVNALRQFIIAARVERLWKIARTPYFFQGNVEPSPFAQQFAGGYESFLALRSFFVDALNGRTSAARPISARARLVLALITWQGVGSWSRLDAVLKNMHRARAIDGLPDAVAVPYDIGDPKSYETAELLRGHTSLAAHNIQSRDIVIKASKRELGDELGRSLPKWLTTLTGEPLIDALLAAARIAHHFEHAPPLRVAWTGALPSIGISISRMQRLFGRQEFGLATAADVSIDKELGDDSARPAVMPDQKAEHLYAQYRKLRTILRAYRERITAAARARSATPRPALSRAEMIASIEQLLKSLGDAKSAPRLLTAYALNLLNDMVGKEPRLELQTVYNYVIGAGGTLMRVHPNANFFGREPEELLLLYRNVVDAATLGYQPFLGRYLSYFHAFLYVHHGVPPVDLRSYGGSVVGLPDVGLVAPREFQAAQRILLAPAQSGRKGSMLIARQSADAATLGYATGVRTSEATNRQLRDLVVEGHEASLLVRRNTLGTVKTRRATRCINLCGWLGSAEIERIAADATAMLRAGQSVRPLFPDADQPEFAVSSDVLSTFIGRALRAATGEPDARNYWLRHTSASMELLQLYGDEFLLNRIARDEAPKIPFPLDDTSSEFAVRLAGNDALSQLHAASFRSRRGHASMTTSITTYLHTISLIESHGSRLSAHALTSQGIGALLDRSPESIRQLLSRGGDTIAGIPRDRALLALVRETPPASAESATSADDPLMITPIKLGAVARCVVRYFRTGDMESSLGLLGATPAARQAARDAILSLPIVSARAPPGLLGDDAKHAIFIVPVRDGRHRLDVGPKSIDVKLIQILLDQVRRGSDKQDKIHSEFWRLMLNGVDTTDSVVRCRSVAELQHLVTGARRYLKDCEAILEPALVASLAIDDAALASELDKYPTLGTLPIKKLQFSKQDRAFLPIAFTLVTHGGQRRLTSVLIVAAAREVWNRLLLDTPDDARYKDS